MDTVAIQGLARALEQNRTLAKIVLNGTSGLCLVISKALVTERPEPQIANWATLEFGF
jgi:hypothetical protein